MFSNDVYIYHPISKPEDTKKKLPYVVVGTHIYNML